MSSQTSDDHDQPPQKVIVRKSTGLEMLRRDVFDALRAVGVVWREGDSWRMQDVELDAFPELAVCDFCTARPVTWYVEAGAFDVPGAPSPMRSSADWMACEDCGQVIRDGDRAALLRRTLAHCRARVPPGYPRAPFLHAQRLLIQAFWRHYRGIRRYATPYGPPAGQP